jgi:hypothetical protein
MGYGLMVYSVDIGQLTATIGSGDDGKRRAICGRFKRSIASINDQLGWSNERGAPSVFEAIRHLVMGDPKTLRGAMYGYGYKTIVEFHGRFLDNSMLYPCPLDVMTDELDPQLAELGIDLSLSELGHASAPVEFPRPDDFPGYGYWSAERVKRALGPARDARTTLSPEILPVLGWLQHAAPLGHGIVGFYH